MSFNNSRIILVSVVFITACTASKQVRQSNASNAISDGKVLMAAYQQKAAEYRALCYQAYNVAKWQLDNMLEQQSTRPKAIMTDIDETVLNNSPYQVHQALQGKDYDAQSWHQWTARADADTVPGALSFFKYAASKGVEIFYVSNRDEAERQPTLQNLKDFGFPDADNEHIKLKSITSSKVPRRDSIAMHFTIIMQVGDNLNDLNGAFEKKDISERFKVTDSLRSEFGHSLIVLPNPSYGDWENALYNYEYHFSPAQKDSVLRSILKNY